MNKWKCFHLISFLTVLVGLAVCADDQPLVPVEPPPSATNLWFDVGENLIYDIYWGIFHVGVSEVTTTWVKHDDGRTLLQIRFKTRTNRVVEQLYPVEDIQETLIDPETFLPVYNLIISRQGKRTQHEITRFDHQGKKAHWESFKKNKKKEVAIESDTRDIISTMYYIRSKTFAVGDTFEMKVFTDEKLFDLFVKIPKKERVELSKYGKVGSFRFDPEAAFNGLFVRKGKIAIWVSNDTRKLCTQISAEVPVAKIHIKLASVSGPGHDFWVGKAEKGAPEVTPIPRF